MAIGVDDLKGYTFEGIRSSYTSSNVRNMSTEDRARKYFEKLQKEYPGINLRKNDMNISLDDNITVNLSPDLIMKAIKDPKIDKSLRKLLDDFKKDKNRIKTCCYSKGGHEVKSVSFLINSVENVSCSIRLKEKVSSDLKGQRKKRMLSSLILREKRSLEKGKDIDKSLAYRYFDLLSKDKFKSIDFTV